MKTRQEVYVNAGTPCVKCRCYPVCNGLACRGGTPGPGGKDSGSAFVRSAEMLKKVFIITDIISDNTEVDTTSEFFGHKVPFPVYVAPVSGILQNYGAKLNDMNYTRILVDGCCCTSTLAPTGDGMYDEMFKNLMSVIAQHESFGVLTIKPWSREHMTRRIKLTREGYTLAIASDIDASGLTNLRTSVTPAGFRNTEEPKEITRVCGDVPFILKGIPSTKGTRGVLETGTPGIIVSSHGGCILDNYLSGIEVLEDVVKMVDGHMKVFMNGALHMGSDVFKALILGADGVLIGRPVPQAVIGDGSDGLVTYLEEIRPELKKVMAVVGCKTTQDTTGDYASAAF